MAKIVTAGYEILNKNVMSGVDIMKHIERCGRVAYQSNWKVTDDSYIYFIKQILEKRHESVLEHYSVSVDIICDRAIANEITRHRIASFTQESTRYNNYSKERFENEISVINPIKDKKSNKGYKIWEESIRIAEEDYFNLLGLGLSPQESRAVLPSCLKTEIVMTCNLREWRHFFKLRTDIAAHPQMRELTIPMLKEFKEWLPMVFEDLIVN